MIILPAIDIIDNKPVRLYQGDYNKKEVVAASIFDTAKSFEQAGAEYIHMVDLDGAKAGKRVNHEEIVRTAKALSVPVEVGGGIRTMADIDYYLNNGIARVILGTAALENEVLLKEALKKYPEQIALGLDCKDGYACASGWLEESKEEYLSFAKKMENHGVKTVIFTDISKDGTLQGPNLEMLEKLSNHTNMNVVASGGIANLENIQDLAKMHLYGAITGKAMYAGTLDLKEAIQAGKDYAD
jgi:phosphoribosylformimino-5-aminoimidazole carboxamide ribotide isomerase